MAPLQVGVMTQPYSRLKASLTLPLWPQLGIMFEQMRRVWWFTATALLSPFCRTYFGSFWLGLNLSVGVLSASAPSSKCKIFDPVVLSRPGLGGLEHYRRCNFFGAKPV